MDAKRPLRVGIYGTGSWANRTHIPNLRRLDGVQLVAACDLNPQSLRATAEQFSIPRTYADGRTMLDQEELDVLYSVVPAFARTDVEEQAALRGIHLFSEKPQATTMQVARRIDAAIERSGVLSTVCFRERYRPLFQEARRLLQDQKITHVRFFHAGGLPPRQASLSPAQQESWHYQMDKAGGPAFDWGVHAVDYARYLSRLDVVGAQAFYYHPAEYNQPLSCSFNFLLEGSATMTMTFLSTAATPLPAEPPFTFFYEGGYLSLWMYDRLEMNGETIYRAEEFDPWFEQDRAFIEAVRTGNRGLILNDYRDGLRSLAPVLAGWQSARRGGALIDLPSFMEA
jgi:predicted dehydrogenase